jgi:hypothetical protein
MPLHLPSTTTGKVWRIDTYKPQGRPAYATASEGELKTERGWQSFSCMIDGSPTHPATKVPIEGPATAKKKAAALEQLKKQLVEAGLAASATPLEAGLVTAATPVD